MTITHETLDQETRRIEVHQAAAAATQKCAERIRRDWPRLQSELLDLMAEIMRVSGEVDAANADAPPGAFPIDRPEGLARGFPDRHSREMPRETELMRLVCMIVPGLTADQVAWPVPATVSNTFNPWATWARPTFREVSEIWRGRQ